MGFLTSVRREHKQARPVVLIVEDQSDVRLAYRLLLEANGFIVLEASQARAAMAVMQAHRVNAVLVDLYLPGGRDGLALIQAIKMRPKPHPVLIAMSGSPHLAYRASLAAADAIGADASLSKPIAGRTLSETIRTLLQVHPEAE